MSLPVRITIAEPSVIIRRGTIELLRQLDSLRFEVFEIDDPEQIRTALARYRSDILILNPSMAGPETLKQIRKDFPQLKVVALATSLIGQSAARDYGESLGLYDSAEQIRGKLIRLVTGPDADPERDTLSPREKEVIACVVMGLTNKQIADKLYLSAHTVITHRRNIANKLQIHSTAGLTIYAIVNKLVDLDDVTAGDTE